MYKNILVQKTQVQKVFISARHSRSNEQITRKYHAISRMRGRSLGYCALSSSRDHRVLYQRIDIKKFDPKSQYTPCMSFPRVPDCNEGIWMIVTLSVASSRNRLQSIVKARTRTTITNFKISHILFAGFGSLQKLTTT